MSGKKPQDYLFCLNVDPDVDPEHPDAIYMSMVEAEFFKANGHLDSVHLQYYIEPFWPESVSLDEVMESCFLIEDGITVEEVRAEFEAAGFIYSEELEKLMEPEL